MGSSILSGRQLAKEIKNEVLERVNALLEDNHRAPKLIVLLVGSDPASQIYVAQKSKQCTSVGIASEIVQLPSDISQGELAGMITKLNKDATVDGVLLQLPLPRQLNAQRSISLIDPGKDVDGLSPHNQGAVQLGCEGLYPCTALGILALLQSVTDLRGRHVVVLGHSILVGSPLSTMLLNAGATVTVAHKLTRNPEAVCASGEILVVATGVRGLVKSHWVKPGAIVIDVGIHRVDGDLFGDVDYDGVQAKARLLTPVPGGVGPLTVAMLLKNCLKAYEIAQGIRDTW